MGVLRFALLLLVFLLPPVTAKAQDALSLIEHPVRICPAQAGSKTVPDFSGAQCRSTRFYRVDPQGRMVWVEAVFVAERAQLESTKPLGLFFSAKASSTAMLNGVPIGANGRPGASATQENAGAMDAVFFVPDGVLRPGENRLVMRLSAMNGGITLDAPIHAIVLTQYRNPRQPGPGIWFAVVTFGLFVAGFVYFGVRAMRAGEGR